VLLAKPALTHITEQLYSSDLMTSDSSAGLESVYIIIVYRRSVISTSNPSTALKARVSFGVEKV
jgi:hypothetical protein